MIPWFTFWPLFKLLLSFGIMLVVALVFIVVGLIIDDCLTHDKY